MAEAFTGGTVPGFYPDTTILDAGGKTPMEFGAEVSPESDVPAYLDEWCANKRVDLPQHACVKILCFESPPFMDCSTTLDCSNIIVPPGMEVETIEGILGPDILPRSVVYEAKDAQVVDQTFSALA